jgi:hypothetical protein
MPGKSRTLLVEKLSPHYERYAQWLEEEHEITVPADHLQVALRHYAAYQKSDFNKAAKEEERTAREKESAKAKATTKKRSRAAAEDEEDEEDEEAAPPARAAKKTPPAKRAGAKGKASF